MAQIAFRVKEALLEGQARGLHGVRLYHGTNFGWIEQPFRPGLETLLELCPLSSGRSSRRGAGCYDPPRCWAKDCSFRAAACHGAYEGATSIARVQGLSRPVTRLGNLGPGVRQ